jgi:4-diphosphocytidyl-2-C-methyl-D-erythritol kinase
MRWPAPAKLNLFLHVLGRRQADGYHELQTLFQLLDWGDELEIDTHPDGQVRRLFANHEVPEHEDLTIRAALLLQRSCGTRHGARIGLFKRIPSGAGLGGGSSDAATVLLVLNRLWGCGLSVQDLARLGRRLGADVPVFVHGHSALATGVGDCLQPVILGARHYVLVMPDTRIATADVFAAPELKRDSLPIDVDDALQGLGRNDCEEVVRQRYPEVDRMMRELPRWGKPRLTGTGSTVFLEFGQASLAKSAAQQLKSHYNVRAVGGVDQSPLMKKLEASRIG